MGENNLPFKNSLLKSRVKAKQTGSLVKCNKYIYIHFTSCNSTVTLHGLMTGMYFFYFFLLFKKNIYFSCSTLTASSNMTWLHALSAEATAVVLGGREGEGFCCDLVMCSYTKSSAGPRGKMAREKVELQPAGGNDGILNLQRIRVVRASSSSQGFLLFPLPQH